MTEATARQHLREMLGHLTPGSALHLLADIFREDAEEARQDDPQAYERFKPWKPPCSSWALASMPPAPDDGPAKEEVA